MNCPISMRFLGHFFVNSPPPSRLVLLGSAPTRLAAANPLSAQVCFQTGAASSGLPVREMFFVIDYGSAWSNIGMA